VNDTKTCAGCGATFTRTRHADGRLERAAYWRTRTYCSRSCAARRADTWKEHLKTCPHCHTTIHRKTLPNGRPESPSTYRDRTYCSKACSIAVARAAKPAPPPKPPKQPKTRASKPATKPRERYWPDPTPLPPVPHATIIDTLKRAFNEHPELKRHLAAATRGTHVHDDWYPFGPGGGIPQTTGKRP
jgi:hypothetical protein